MNERLYYFIIGLVVLLAITIPYLYAAQAGGSDYIFGGFLMNVWDGNSYLAKMYQGWRGEWRFTLPYTAEAGEGGYLNTFYLGLGHMARILKIPLLLAFHFARVLGTGCLLWALARFYRSLFPSPQSRKLAFAISALGSGLGWLAIPFGAFTADFWVAETYPFLSAYVNPHFVFGLAIVVWLVTPLTKKHPLLSFSASLALGLIAPFGVVIVIIVLGSSLLVEVWKARINLLTWLRDVQPRCWNLIAVCLGGGPVLLYDYWITHSDPVLTGWNAQNLCITPDVWDVLLALSPVLVIAVYSIRQAWADKRSRLLVLWAGLGLVLIFVPWSLQRRFMMGLFIPLAGLAALGVEYLSMEIKSSYRVLVVILFIFSLPTNFMVLISGFHAVQTHELKIYFTVEETQALAWIEEHTPHDALILAGPETGVFIPARTGRRVIYGHPYETVDASKEEETVTKYFAGEMILNQAESLLETRGVDYILVSPRERVLGEAPGLSNAELLFSNNNVQIYGVLP